MKHYEVMVSGFINTPPSADLDPSMDSVVSRLLCESNPAPMVFDEKTAGIIAETFHLAFQQAKQRGEKVSLVKMVDNKFMEGSVDHAENEHIVVDSGGSLSIAIGFEHLPGVVYSLDSPNGASFLSLIHSVARDEPDQVFNLAFVCRNQLELDDISQRLEDEDESIFDMDVTLGWLDSENNIHPRVNCNGIDSSYLIDTNGQHFEIKGNKAVVLESDLEPEEPGAGM